MRLTILLPLGVCLLLGCATTEPLATYFMLTGAGATAKAAKPPPPAAAVRVYVRRVEVPAYLNRTNLASMHGDQIRYSPTGLWALSLDQTISLGIASNLNRLGISAAGFQPSFSVPAHTYDVLVHVTHFEGHESGDVLLSGNWQVLGPGGGVVASKSVAIRRAGWTFGNDGQLVALLSSAVTELSDQIARALR
ncbi:MAG: membrane integrity-associated transporter subunit PqiC [Verrucomicrobia bacterium]|nr:membrane integrity-associated transporter subunit PqiC [Verrucomicrobiota bacterium]